MNINLQKLTLTAVLSALIVAMTFIPYTGYIMYAPIALEITTLHVVVILGAVALGPTGGFALGSVWGLTCLLRAVIYSANPLFVPFLNPLVSVLPRMLVGLFAGLVFWALVKRSRCSKSLSAIIAGVVGTLTNTVFVLTMYNLFAGNLTGLNHVWTLFKSFFLVYISVNGLIELALAVILVPLLYQALKKPIQRMQRSLG